MMDFYFQMVPGQTVTAGGFSSCHKLVNGIPDR
jgi:hypothetical protein